MTLLRQGEGWSLGLSAKVAGLLLGRPRGVYDVMLSQRFRLFDQAALRLDLWRRLEFARPAEGGLVGVLVYF
jgi:hypothetical protein